ncbi:hypothetical protein CEXT_240911 [Caerostris extrusa]|uniref:Uncharacterized protein n=1 Tax=Caerostris extrusa TaxID=172846 RepID=A0AAV4XDP6_CAEEX|nr:hypothetical protein CEXT_240911 [Caerostris extrusa]
MHLPLHVSTGLSLLKDTSQTSRELKKIYIFSCKVLDCVLDLPSKLDHLLLDCSGSLMIQNRDSRRKQRVLLASTEQDRNMSLYAPVAPKCGSRPFDFDLLSAFDIWFMRRSAGGCSFC